MEEEIEKITPPDLSLCLQELHDEEVEWYKMQSGISRKLMGSYQDFLLSHLKDKDKAVAYLNDALEHDLKFEKPSEQIFLIALRNVILAQGGISSLSKKTGLGRESLYKTLSATCNPKLNTLLLIFKALGLKITIT